MHCSQWGTVNGRLRRPRGAVLPPHHGPRGKRPAPSPTSRPSWPSPTARPSRSGGDPHLGGDDWDAAIVAWLEREHLHPAGVDTRQPEVRPRAAALRGAGHGEATPRCPASCHWLWVVKKTPGARGSPGDARGGRRCPSAAAPSPCRTPAALRQVAANLRALAEYAKMELSQHESVVLR
jgi:hypothetical protein